VKLVSMLTSLIALRKLMNVILRRFWAEHSIYLKEGLASLMLDFLANHDSFRS
jgi:hypothetical protein